FRPAPFRFPPHARNANAPGFILIEHPSHELHHKSKHKVRPSEGAVRIQSLEISTATFLRRVAVGPATSLTTACCAHAMGQDGCHEGTRQVRARVGASVEA